MRRTGFSSIVRVLKNKNPLPKASITLGLSVIAAGVLMFASAYAENVTNWAGNGTTNGYCSTVSADSKVAAGKQQWLFVLTSPDTGPWKLYTTFDTSEQTPGNPVDGRRQGNGAVQFTVTTAIGAKLENAYATNGTARSTLTVSHCTYHAKLMVSKTAVTSYTRDFDWTIFKSVDKDDLVLSRGQQADVHYTVAVTRDSGTDSDWAVSGTITVVNTDPLRAANGVVVTDAIPGHGNVPVVCPSATIAAGATMECTYGPVALNNATSLTNTAQATTTTAGIESGSGEAAVTFGDPTTVEDDCVDVSDTVVGDLGKACASRTFDYMRTILADTLQCGNNTVGNTASLATDDGVTRESSANVSVSVSCATVCTLSQGYWKTYSERGPAPYDNTWSKLEKGADTLFFTSGKTWHQTFTTAPAGNAYYILASQYMAAELNVLNGASTPAEVQSAISQAKALFGNSANTPTKIGSLKGNDALRQNFITLAGILGSYNEGRIGPGHCSE